MFSRRLLMGSILSLFLSASVHAEPDAKIPPIEALEGVAPNDAPKGAAGRAKPIEVSSAEDAAKYFDEENLKALQAQVDFKEQFVLVFAWRGSGGDRLDFAIAESYPEQIFFTLTPGRTRDLRSHTAVYALRSNVKWSVR